MESRLWKWYLFLHAKSFQRQDRRSCMVRCEDLFILEELRRPGGRLKAHTAPGIDGVPNEILKEVIALYPVILPEAFNSYLREEKFFDEWKRPSWSFSGGRETSGGGLILKTTMSVGYNGEASGGNDFTMTTVTWLAKKVSRRTSSDFRKAGLQ